MPVITQNDFLNPLFSLHPILVALIIWVAGWGYLFLMALRTGEISALLKHPGNMIGDFLMLPLAGFLITLFYQSVGNPANIITSAKWMYVSLTISVFLTIFIVLGGIFITKSKHTLWYVPHIVFSWVFAYIMINFLIKGVLQLLSNSTLFLWSLYTGVIVSIAIHIIFMFIFGPKLII